MAVRFIALISPMVPHYVIASSTACPRSSGALSPLHGVQSLWPSVAFIHLLLPRSRSTSAARLVVLCTKHVFHSWKEGAVFILEKGVREADGRQWDKAITLLILVGLLHRADRVELVLLGALLVQLALRRGQLLGVRLRLGVSRGGRRGYVVRVRGLLLRVGLGVRVVGVGLLML